MSRKNRKHYSDIDIDSSSSDDEYNDLTEDDYDIINEAKLRKRLKKRTHTNSNWIISDDEHNTSDDNDVYDIMKNLLDTPLTADERTIYTARGIEVQVEHGRVKKMWPHGRVNISSWETAHIISSFDNWLRRIGSKHYNYSVYLEWKNLKSPYMISWSDLGSLSIPWNRSQMRVFLKKKENLTKRKQYDEFEQDGKQNEKDSKKRKKCSKNAVKNERRKQCMLLLSGKNGLGEKYVKFINERNDAKMLWYRIIHLYDRCNWGIVRIKAFIRDNFMVMDITTNINQQKVASKVPAISTTDINNETKNILSHSNNSNNDIPVGIHGIAQDTKYWDTVFMKDTALKLPTPPPIPVTISSPPPSPTKPEFNENKLFHQVMMQNQELSMELANLRKLLQTATATATGTTNSTQPTQNDNNDNKPIKE